MREENRVVNGCWFGPHLTNMQILCIRSYQDAGHEFHLWISEPCSGIPAGTVIHDMNETNFFNKNDRHRFTGTNYMSDYFRVKLLKEFGGWYVDTDTVCLQAFDFEEPYVFVSEPENLGPPRDVRLAPTPPLETRQNYFSHCIMKGYKGNDLCQHVYDRINGSDTRHPSDWICFGPRMFADVVRMLGQQRYAQPPVVFDALNYNEGEHAVTGGVDWSQHFTSKSYAIHFRASGWVHAHRNFDGKFPEDCLYEQLKRKHGVRTI